VYYLFTEYLTGLLFSPQGILANIFLYFLNNLARSANLPEGLYILQMFFLYFFIFFNG